MKTEILKMKNCINFETDFNINDAVWFINYNSATDTEYVDHGVIKVIEVISRITDPDNYSVHIAIAHLVEFSLGSTILKSSDYLFRTHDEAVDRLSELE